MAAALQKQWGRIDLQRCTTDAIERINEEFRRRTKTQASLPGEEAVLLLMYGLLRSGQIRLRRTVGWKDIPRTKRTAEAP